MNKGKKNKGDSSDDTDPELGDTAGSNFVVHLDEKRVDTLTNLGYPREYVHFTINENEANYCTTGYYLLAIDQNY